MTDQSEKQFWTNRYLSSKTGWDIGSPSTPIVEYVNQLEDKSIKILIPGAGNAYEAEYLWSQGFTNVHVLDISQIPLDHLSGRVVDFPNNQAICGDFFEHVEQYDLILEQTFFCSFEPHEETRKAYAEKMHSLLNENGKLVGLWFDIPLAPLGNRPFGGNKEEYLDYLSPYFEVVKFESCYNSIKPRAGTELFGIFKKADL